MTRFFLLVPFFLWSCHSPTSPAVSEMPGQTVQAATPAPEPSQTPERPPAVSDDWNIIPGKKIGHTTLGEDPEILLKRLGRPDASDAAMGKAWLVWDGKNSDHTLAVFTTYADSTMLRKAIRQIRITSPRFQTADGLHTGSKRLEIERSFPEIKPATHSLAAAAPRYDAVSKGISFEFSGERADASCTAIIVYPAGGMPTAYLPIPEQ